MALKLYTTPGNPRAAKALIAAAYNNVQIDVVPDFQFGVTNKTKEYLKLNPNGKIPTLVTPEGAIWESNAIARYVARLADNGLYGRNKLEAAQVDQWLDWVSGELELASSVWLYPIWGIIPNVPEATANAQEDVKKNLAILNAYLLTRTYLVGERITLADIVVASSLSSLYKTVLDPNFRKPFPNVNRWFTTVVNQPNFVKVLGEVTLATSQAVAPDAPAQAAAAPAPAKKEAAKPVAKKETPKEESAEEAAPAPTSKGIDQETWKRVYSNEDNTRDACKWLWEHYDPANNSLWFAEYKYNDELGKTFMSLNLIGGFFQRLDSFRKKGFGTLILFGDNDKSAIAGVFLVSGSSGMIPELGECPDAESYNFTKVDTNDAEQKAKVDNYLCWEVEYNGLKFNQGKTFK